MITESTLAKIEIFRDLNERARTELCRQAVVKSYAKGEPYSGERGNRLAVCTWG